MANGKPQRKAVSGGRGGSRDRARVAAQRAHPPGLGRLARDLWRSMHPSRASGRAWPANLARAGGQTDAPARDRGRLRRGKHPVSTRRADHAPAASGLVRRRFRAAAPDRLWAADITLLPDLGGLPLPPRDHRRLEPMWCIFPFPGWCTIGFLASPLGRPRWAVRSGTRAAAEAPSRAGLAPRGAPPPHLGATLPAPRCLVGDRGGAPAPPAQAPPRAARR
jgi:hypothetical protein